jgi:adenine-specific DNA-methyltransferase
MAKKIKAYKHADKRSHTPSTEEKGMEQNNPKVKGKEQLYLPKKPVVHRGQDPELFWMNKYDDDEADHRLQVDIRSLYRHEHISPEMLMNGLYKMRSSSPSTGGGQGAAPTLFDVFGNTFELDELEKPTSYYTHQDGWSNRLIQGDSLLVMTSLLEREGMAGKVQCIYMDPPYGIKYGSNWQMQLNKRDVKDGSDEHLTGEPEMIKAYRDTWELGIHSYLSYMRDRLLVAKELLTESGSCFVQISDENVHLVRSIMDEVFGSENFVNLISFVTTSGFDSTTLPRNGDYFIWYARNSQLVKYKNLFREKETNVEAGNYKWLMFEDGEYRGVAAEELRGNKKIPDKAKLYQPTSLISQGTTNTPQEFQFKGKKYNPGNGQHWKTTVKGLNRLAERNRIHVAKNSIRYVRYADDFPYRPYTNFWDDTATGNFTDEKIYVVQTSRKAIERCLLMTTDPGDLVLDPTCGSGTTAFVAEQWGRRWITRDTSRIALNIAKTRLMTALFHYYYLHDEVHRGLIVNGFGNSSPTGGGREGAADIRNGFVYETVPHITLKSLANDEPAETEILYDKPKKDNKRIRVSGPFTVETLQNFEPIAPEELEKKNTEATDITGFEQKIFQHLKSAGVKNGLKNENRCFYPCRTTRQCIYTRRRFLSNTKRRTQSIFPYWSSVRHCQQAGSKRGSERMPQPWRRRLVNHSWF